MSARLRSGDALEALRDVVGARGCVLIEELEATFKLVPACTHHVVLVVDVAGGARLERRSELAATYDRAGVHRLASTLRRLSRPGQLTVLVDSDHGVTTGQTTVEKLRRVRTAWVTKEAG